MRIFQAVLVLFLAFAIVPSTASAEGRRVILVLDASGSMWGQIGDKSKMQIAKGVVGKVICTWKPEDEIGLVAYGHRKKGACDDIEVLQEPGALDAASFMAKVNGLAPKGKTPMTQAVRMAAEALKYTEKQATVILVSDGIETCDPNPCAVAEELEKLGVDLTVHTVGFGLDDKGAVDQLKCLAEKTGGISIIAENAGQLEAALNKTVEAKAEPAPAIPTPQPAAPEFNITGHASMAESVEFPKGFDTPVWEFYPSINGEKGEWLKTEFYRDMKTNIDKDGDYIVKISNDLAKIDVPFSVVAGKPVDLDVSLEAGIVKLKGMLDDKTPITSDRTTWELLDPSYNSVPTKMGPEVVFLANAGSYKIRLKLGTAMVEEDLTITAGKIDEHVMTLGAGMIEASAVFSQGGEPVPAGANFELRKAEVALDGSHQWVDLGISAPSRFTVRAGNYLMIVTHDFATASAMVEVKAGALTKVEFNLNAGYLAVTTSGARIIVYEATKSTSGERKRVPTEQNETINKAFSAGTYHLVTLDANDKVLYEKDFEVKAGQRTEGTIP